MKKILPLILVALGSFFAVWYLNRGDLDDEESSTHVIESSESPQFRKDDPRLVAGGAARRDQKPREDLVVDLKGSEQSEEFGQLKVAARLGQSVPPELVINLVSKLEPTVDLSGRAEDQGDSLLFRKLSPGSYDVWLYGGEIVPILYRDVRIAAGKRRSLSFDLEKGLLFKGRVVTAFPAKPVPFAWVEFDGRGRTECDANGNFAMTQRLSRSALRSITVGAEGWDTQTYRNLGIPDPENMELPLGYGDREVTLEIINRTTTQIPNNWTARVTIQPLYHTRRVVNLQNGESQVTIDNLYASDYYRFELHFPGGEFPVQKKKVPLQHGDEKTTIPFIIEEGASLHVECSGPEMLKQAGEMQLRDFRGEIMARCRMKEGGFFRFGHVAPAKYTAILVTSGSQKTLGSVTLAANEQLEFKLDLLRNKLARK